MLFFSRSPNKKDKWECFMHVTQIIGISHTHYLISFVRITHHWGSFLLVLKEMMKVLA